MEKNGSRPRDPFIREFRVGDYYRVMELWRQGGLPLKPQGRDSRDEIAVQIGLANVRFLVAEEAGGGPVVGTVLATHDGRKGWINRLAVDASRRRQGIGARLVRAAEDWLGAQGLGILACLIEEGNAVSMAVFEALGYTKRPDVIYFTKRKFPGV